MLSSKSVVFPSLHIISGEPFCHCQKIKPYNGHFALRVLTESRKLFLCADKLMQKLVIKGKVTPGVCGLRLDWMGQWSRGSVDEIVSALV